MRLAHLYAGACCWPRHPSTPPTTRPAPKRSCRASVSSATAPTAKARARCSRAWPASTRATWRASWPTTSRGRRKSSTMQPMVDDLSPADFKALGAVLRGTRRHARTRSPTPSWRRWGASSTCAATRTPAWPPAPAATAPTGHGTDTLPRLAGQHAQYTENQLKPFNKRERTNDNAVMHAHCQQAHRAGAEGRGGLHQRAEVGRAARCRSVTAPACRPRCCRPSDSA